MDWDEGTCADTDGDTAVDTGTGLDTADVFRCGFASARDSAWKRGWTWMMGCRHGVYDKEECEVADDEVVSMGMRVVSRQDVMDVKEVRMD